MATSTERIAELLEPTLRHLGYELVAVELAGPGGRTLRLTIDADRGISLDDCQRVSDLAGPVLDQANLIPHAYTLEVSSPGAERPLRNRADYDRYLGKRVSVRYRPAGAETSEVVLEGRLTSVSDTGVTIRSQARVKGRTLPVREVVVGWEELVSGKLSLYQ